MPQPSDSRFRTFTRAELVVLGSALDDCRRALAADPAASARAWSDADVSDPLGHLRALLREVDRALVPYLDDDPDA